MQNIKDLHLKALKDQDEWEQLWPLPGLQSGSESARYLPGDLSGDSHQIIQKKKLAD